MIWKRLFDEHLYSVLVSETLKYVGGCTQANAINFLPFDTNNNEHNDKILQIK